MFVSETHGAVRDLRQARRNGHRAAFLVSDGSPVAAATPWRREPAEAKSARRGFGPEAYLGASRAAREVRQMLHALSGVPFSALLISGETGTGKGLAAKILHQSGARAQGPFIEVNCATLPRDLMESELFGHEAGAFTGAKGAQKGLLEQASGGTLFLDEVADLDISLQPKLLNAIEDRVIRRLGAEQTIGIDLQIVAATNGDLARETSAGRFRPDLYHRLNVFEIALPPLRDRMEDIEDLTLAFVAEFNRKADKEVKVVPGEVWQLLMSHSWPGNVRELRNVVERTVLLSNSETLPIEWVRLRRGEDGQVPDPAKHGDCLHLPLDGSMALADMDRHIIATALSRNHHNVMATARALGTTRETLRYRIRKYGLARKGAAEEAGRYLNI